MGLVETEIGEIRELMADFKAGKIALDRYTALLAGYEQSNARLKNLLHAMSLVGKYGGKIQDLINTTKLIGNGDLAATSDSS